MTTVLVVDAVETRSQRRQRNTFGFPVNVDAGEFVDFAGSEKKKK